MKNKINIIIVLFTAVFFNSCQDVVDIPLNTENPKLVIDASIIWQKGTTGNNQVIKLSTTTDFYTNVIPPVSGATVFIKNSSNIIFNFTETPNTGIYLCNNFIPVIDETYSLTVINNGQNYTAKETLKSVAVITSVTQEKQSGLGTDFLKLKTFFNDPANAENYYLYKYKFSKNLKPEYSVDDDQFFQGNNFFSLVLEEDTAAGQTVEITHYGISKANYNYMTILLGVAGSSGGGPFQTPPATVRGNIKNESNFDNYPLGYFRLSESDVRNYTIQ
ncbi:DUF4249 domain-containing protein [Flavobacterium psychrotolerans]|uniref:DUF4249 domain-containing protein n=1 Tax=Flavobacterium psychrotolerans TaxID=2169410 RepID=A0A2U1JFM5_9FLAO|nr:DUF4249 domain-containing protein [Flavobacterium psychrotolerans]PWA03932.1 DUF4249 domain-containing protein [Flavobacterium psychrotolerans]